jgi:hypothetical protein
MCNKLRKNLKAKVRINMEAGKPITAKPTNNSHESEKKPVNEIFKIEKGIYLLIS